MNFAILWDAADGSASFARELVDAYLEQVAGELVRLRAALDDRSGPRVQAIAHFCKGSSHACGATTIASLFGELSRLGETGQVDEARRVAAAIELEFTRVRAVLTALPSPPGVRA